MAARSDLKPAWLTLRPRGLPLSYRLDRRVPLVALIIVLITLAVLVIAVSTGEYHIAPGDVIQTILGTNSTAPDYANFKLVVWTFRLPRIVLAFLVGAALATSGTLLQGLTRNALADPGILGVSSGAAFMAVLIIVQLKTVSLSVLPWAALAGGLITAAIIYVLAWKGGTVTPIRLILIGIAVEAVLSAFTTMMLVFGNINDVQQAYVWMTGSVYGRGWEHVQSLGIWLVALLPIAFLSARSLNTMGLGEDAAKGLGLRMELQRGVLLVVSVALAAAAVAVSGTIGFVGLVAPHVARRLVGPSHEGLVPIAALFGGALLAAADLIGRVVIAPSELPVGIVTAMIGAPYFLYLLYRNRNR